MRKLPDIRIIPARMAQKQALARWLNEWRVDQELLDGDGLQIADDQRRVATENKRIALRYDSEPIRACQIRLFHPFSKETHARARHIVVLKGCDGGSWLVAPFGRFSEAAGPGEWRTGLRVPVLRILCLWNARVITESVLGYSWVVGCMSTSRVAQALAIQKRLAEGKEISSPLGKRVGPPLMHPLDPRIEYMQEEREWFASVAAKGAVEVRRIHPRSLSDGGVSALPRAAESRPKYQAKEKKKPDHSH
jgi:hypothetical protein